jgi:uncharacterized protein YjiS (DUF1127 family)
MSATTFSAAGRPASTRSRGPLALVGSLWHGYRRHRARVTTVRQLRGLSDNILRDIGVHPGDIEAAVRDRR